MKRADEQLSRLLKAAAAAPDPESADPAPYLLRQILAQWRAAGGQRSVAGLIAATIAHGKDCLPKESLVAALVFRRALVCAFIVMALTVAWAHRHLVEPLPNEVAIAEYETRMTLSP